MDGPKRVSRVNGRSTTSARRGQIRAAPNSTSAAMASVRVNPFARPTPSITEAMPTIAITNVTVSPLITPSGRRRPPVALAESSAGRTGSTQGVSAVPAPASTANATRRAITGVCAAALRTD